ncbi:MAG: heavy-metal-associated domain-containing protein [Acidimicrobiales bacterium]
MITSTYTVEGMSCGHCVSAVSAEMGKLSGVTTVEVDLARGTVTVASTEPLAREDVARAVDEAGYELISDGPGTGP